MFRTITAKYPGTCRRCGGSIQVGECIRYGGYGRTYHFADKCNGQRPQSNVESLDATEPTEDNVIPPDTNVIVRQPVVVRTSRPTPAADSLAGRF
jgi:hypothetical protein